MENLSQITVDESSVSMYFSFNNTTTCKTLENSNDFSVHIEDENSNLNDTLEAVGEEDQTLDHCQTIKKSSISVSPDNRLPKSILRTYQTLSSTPNEAQLLRSVETNRGSGPDVMNVCDLGLNFLEAPQEIIPPEEKENQEIPEVVHSERSSDLSTIQKEIPKLMISSAGHESDVAAKQPLKITSSKNVSTSKDMFRLPTDQNCPKKGTSAFNIAKRLSSNRRSVSKQETPFHLLGKTTRMSIVKTTLNSPAQKTSRRTLTQMGRNIPTRYSIFPKKSGSQIDSKTTGLPSVSETRKDKSRKSIFPKTISSPEKRLDSVKARKSLIPSSLIKNCTKITGQKEPVPANTIHNKFSWLKPPRNLVCEVCSQKFVISSLFEAHKKTHDIVPTSASTRSTLSLTIDNKCRYCDKHFAISKALRNHLVENCIKIPPGDKKKLLFSKETKIETQTKLPSKSIPEPNNSNKPSRFSTVKATVPPTMTSNKIKQKRAHSGVYCTPNKQLICHICSKQFNNILAFTEHKLSHSTVPINGLSQNELAPEKDSQKT